MTTSSSTVQPTRPAPPPTEFAQGWPSARNRTGLARERLTPLGDVVDAARAATLDDRFLTTDDRYVECDETFFARAGLTAI